MSKPDHVQVKPLGPEGPASSAINWEPPQPTMTERDALAYLKDEWKRKPTGTPDYGGTRNREVLILDLDEHEFYGSPGSKRENEFCPMYTHSPELVNVSLNGFVSLGKLRVYVQSVPLISYTIEGYGDADDGTVTIFVQSKTASKDKTHDIWYRLTDRPTTGYRRFYNTFLWIATFGKHFLDYLGAHPHTTLGLNAFRSDFHTWLQARFKDGDYFHAWKKQFGRSDFRQHVNAHREYLFNQAHNLPDRDILLHHDVWGDCMAGGLTSIKPRPVESQKTIATELVYRCFKSMYFGHLLEEMSPTGIVREKQNRLKQTLGFPTDLSNPASMPIATGSSLVRPRAVKEIAVGDVVEVPPDAKTRWKETGENWLAYVWRVQRLQEGTQQLGVLWLCRPSETVIDEMVYPIKKEIFLTENCNCGKNEAPLLSSEVLRTHSIDWCPKDLNTKKDFLIRQKYNDHDGSFVTFKRSDLTCPCKKLRTRPSYQPGDTVYIKTQSSKSRPFVLQPVLISGLKPGNIVTVRYLRWLKGDCLGLLNLERRHGLPENELVWTDDFVQINADQIIRKCHVRWFPKATVISGKIPVTYNRRGNGDFYILARRLTRITKTSMRLEFLTSVPDSLTQGPDFEANSCDKPLQGLSIFGGSGNLDRGLEEGGAVHFHTVVDFSPEAIHTQKANARDPENLKLYCWSVDDFLKALLAGEIVVDNVQLLAGGAPCPGFSTMQRNPFGESSCRQASHITTICSYADLLRPQWGIFENVINMASTRKGHEEDNVLSQVVACFVAMGYQVRHEILDAWSYSSAQRRARLFIFIAAPGLEPLGRPWHTHSHPETILGRSLGKGPNGLSLGDREDYATPFSFTTAEEAISDLPDIGSGCLQACISHPDHRTTPVSLQDRIIMRNIPVYPPAQGYAEAIKLGLVPRTAMKNMSEVGKSFRRMNRKDLMPTITTTMDAQNSRSSGALHYKEPRTISLAECKRAQGYLDDDVIIGNFSHQLRTVGNAVDRNTAFAVALQLRQAWEKSKHRIQHAAPQAPPQSNGIKPATVGLTSTIFKIFGGEEKKKGFQHSTPVKATLKPNPTNRYRGEMTAGRPSRDVKSEPITTPLLKTSPDPTPAKHQVENVSKAKRLPSATENSGPNKKVKYSTTQTEYRSTVKTTVTQQEEPQNSKSQSIYSERTVVTIRSERSVSTVGVVNDGVSHVKEHGKVKNGGKSLPSSKHKKHPQELEIIDLTEENEVPDSKRRRYAMQKQETTDNESCSTLSAESRKRTRHSGLKVEFTPGDWSKKPESVLCKRAD